MTVQVGDVVLVDQYGEGHVVDTVPESNAVLVEFEEGDQWFDQDDVQVIY